MPILKREADLFPADLFASGATWRVAHLKSRQEKSLARFLGQSNIGYYLPQCEKRVLRSGRTVVSYLPLFPGYLFFRGEAAELARSYRSHLIVSVLTPHDQDLFESELRQIHDLQRTSGRLVPYPELAPGDAVAITDGIFAGYRGVIVREKSSERLVVTVSFISQSVAVEIDRESVMPAGASAGRASVTS